MNASHAYTGISSESNVVNIHNRPCTQSQLWRPGRLALRPTRHTAPSTAASLVLTHTLSIHTEKQLITQSRIHFNRSTHRFTAHTYPRTNTGFSADNTTGPLAGFAPVCSGRDTHTQPHSHRQKLTHANMLLLTTCADTHIAFRLHLYSHTYTQIHKFTKPNELNRTSQYRVG